MDYRGVIIEESLKDRQILDDVIIIETNVENVTEKHKTPWLKQWTLHTIEIDEDKADGVVEKLSNSLDKNYWYADFKNDSYHYIVYPSKSFKVDLRNPILYKDAKAFGISLGIPPYQVDFAPDDKIWER